MPNWTHAKITVADEDHTRAGAEQLMDFMTRLRAAADEPDDYHLTRTAEVSLALAFHPMPAELRGDVPGANPPWLTWAQANWGTKWPDVDTKITETSDDRLVLECRFPWTLANGLLAKVSAEFPALTVAADWDDEYDGAWYSTRFQAGELAGQAERPDLEIADLRRLKAEYIENEWCPPHDCEPGRCAEEDCPLHSVSNALKAHLAGDEAS